MNELQQVIVTGVGTMARLMVLVSDATRRAAETLEAVAHKLEDEQTAPAGPTVPPYDTVPPVEDHLEGPPVNP